MFPVQVHLVLNHVPLTGLVFGLVFYTLGIKKSSEAELLTGERIFVAMAMFSIPIAASGLRSAHALSAAHWLEASEVHLHNCDRELRDGFVDVAPRWRTSAH